jgi:hypothetical protein
MRAPATVFFYQNPGNDLAWINEDIVLLISSPEVAPAIDFGAGIFRTFLSFLEDLLKPVPPPGHVLGS